MITGELKNKVDALWDTLWTGGITNPITAVEQITYLMFMKLLDDRQLNDEAQAKLRGTPLSNSTFKDGMCIITTSPRLETEYRNLRWSIFCHYEPSAMLEHIRHYVFPFIKSMGQAQESAFSHYMKDTVFLIPTGSILAKVVEGINAIDMSRPDLMGDVYEYLLSKMAVSGENGQFRTPRHIIDMVVQLMQPSLCDRILDPAMGSAGFLQQCCSYISEHRQDELKIPHHLSYFKSGLCTGFDTDQSMLRIGAMNMMLHGVDMPCIRYMDALSKDNTERGAYSLIIANPPFKGRVFSEHISPDLTDLCPSTKTELLFMALFTKMLKIGGRCASIVPDGVLFGSSRAHRALRKELVEHQQLRAVISMPAGVFKPYAGVSTAILIFTRTDAGGTENVWFYDMRSDGFSPDDKRLPIAQNDIPDIIERFRHPETEAARERTEQSFFVPREEIAAHDYDLSINKYKKIIHIEPQYPPTAEILSEMEQAEEQIRNTMAELRKLLEQS